MNIYTFALTTVYAVNATKMSTFDEKSTFWATERHLEENPPYVSLETANS